MSNAAVRTRPRSRLQRHLAAMAGMLLLSAVCYVEAGQQPIATAVTANFKQAYKYSPEFLNKFAYSTNVVPNWIGKTDTFWYEYRTSKGKYYYRVNPQQAAREPLFDNAKLCTLLSEMTRKPLDAALLPLTTVSVSDDGNKMKFVTEDMQYEYDLRGEKLVKLGKAPAGAGGGNFPGKGGGKKGGADDDAIFQDGSWDNDLGIDQQFDVDEYQEAFQQKGKKGKDGKGGFGAGGKQAASATSPDGKLHIYSKDYNVYIAEEGKDDIQLTKDGVQDYIFVAGGKGFGGGGGKDGGGKEGGGGGGKAKADLAVNWAKDSTAFYVLRSDGRGIKDLYLVNAIAQPRPTLTKYGYPMPGEENIRRSELHIWHKTNGKLVRAEPKWKDETYGEFHWGKNADELRFMRHDRLLRNIEFCTMNVATRESKCLITEGFENANIVTHAIKYLDESNELLWWSERSGWGHFYLYDRDGKLKNAITSGNYRASAEVDFDNKNRLFYFHGNSREEGENAYFEHLYSVHLDGSGLTLLDPGNGHHQSSLSPSRQFVVDNCSRTDMPTVAVLRDHRGAKIMDLEKADISRLQEVGWKIAETFVLKAADGTTDLYGNMWKPFDFDPKKKYPIIAHVYPGPQTESMNHFFQPVNQQQQLAQLGFIVIQVGNRGGSPLRSKLYGSFGYFNLRDYALADKKTAIEQLAARFSFIDIDKVGIYGHSGGGFLSAAAMLQKPYNEFFKVAVSSSGNHDNNIYNNSWSERYHGLQEVPVGGKDDIKDATTFEKGKGKGKGKGKKGGGDEAFDQDKGELKQDQDKGELKQDQDKGKEDKKADQKKEMGKDDGKGKVETKFVIKVPTNAELAGNLKGKLLLVHGDMDNNVHPANTIRLVDALIKANKRFDMLVLPGQAHAFGPADPYFRERMWEYFAEHLLGDRARSADIYDRRDNH